MYTCRGEIGIETARLRRDLPTYHGSSCVSFHLDDSALLRPVGELLSEQNVL